MAQLERTLDEVVRRDGGRVRAQLVRQLGSLDAAEEAFQEAVLAALATWPARGVPENPGGWLMTAARNHARDQQRHRRVVDEKAPALREDHMTEPVAGESVADDELRLVFTCCHPALPRELQVALTLKLIAGLSTEEIARAFLYPEATIAQRIVRAKRAIEAQRLPYEVPGRGELPARIASVLAVVYLVFNEGHTSHSGALMRLDLQREALRLARLLCDLLPEEPDVFALFALITFGCARAATRSDEDGQLVLLAEQDRARWDRGLIKEGLVALARALRLGPRSSLVLQAEIAAHHAIAPSWGVTDWAAILACYDALVALDPSPVIALNRAVALAMQAGPAAGLAALEALATPLAGYHHFFATRADLRRRAGLDARADYQRALELASNDSERRFLQKKQKEIDQG